MRTHPNLHRLLGAALLSMSWTCPAVGHPPGNHHEQELVGVVETIASDQWVIGGTAVRITQTTEIDVGIAVGDRVEAEVLSADGTLAALEIEFADDDVDDNDNDNDDDDDDDYEDDDDDDDDEDDD